MNKKLKAVLFSAFAACFLAQSAWADEIWNFTRITCISELNYFEASNVEINSGSNEESKFMGENQERIRKKYNLRGESLSDIQECKLKDANLKIQIKYRAGKDGLCGRSSSAILKLWINDKLMVDLDNFNDDCVNSEGVVHVGFKIRYKEPIIYFKNRDYMGTEQLCLIWLNSDMKKILSNDCKKSELSKVLPIQDNQIIETKSCASCATRELIGN